MEAPRALLALLQVFAQRRHSIHRVLIYEDELFALMTLVLDKHTLSNSSSTFADSLYGLRRAPFQRDAQRYQALSKRHQTLALIMQVIGRLQTAGTPLTTFCSQNV